MTLITKSKKIQLQEHGRKVAQEVFTPQRLTYSWVEHGKPLPGVEEFSPEADIVVRAFNEQIKDLMDTLPSCDGVKTHPHPHELLINGVWHSATVDASGSRYRLPDGSITSNSYVLSNA